MKLLDPSNAESEWDFSSSLNENAIKVYEYDGKTRRLELSTTASIIGNFLELSILPQLSAQLPGNTFLEFEITGLKNSQSRGGSSFKVETWDDDGTLEGVSGVMGGVKPQMSDEIVGGLKVWRDKNLTGEVSTLKGNLTLSKQVAANSVLVDFPLSLV